MSTKDILKVILLSHQYFFCLIISIYCINSQSAEYLLYIFETHSVSFIYKVNIRSDTVLTIICCVSLTFQQQNNIILQIISLNTFYMTRIMITTLGMSSSKSKLSQCNIVIMIYGGRVYTFTEKSEFQLVLLI